MKEAAPSQGLPGVQSIDRTCSTLGCNIATTCEFLLECFDEAANSYDVSFPISAEVG